MSEMQTPEELTTARSQESPPAEIPREEEEVNPANQEEVKEEPKLPVASLLDKESVMEGFYEVVIVGAGPTGLFLASLLNNFGISAAVLEAEHQIDQKTPRACLLTQPALQALPKGIVSKIMPYCLKMKGLNFHVNNKRSGELTFPPSLEMPLISTIPQHHVENVFVNDLERRVKIHRGLHVTGVEWLNPSTEDTSPTDPSTANVCIFCEHKDRIGRFSRKLHVFEAAMVVGCDGGRSVLRQNLGIQCNVTAPVTEHLVFQGTIAWGTPLPEDRVHIIRSFAGTMLAMPMYNGEWRVIISSEQKDVRESTFVDTTGVHPPYTKILAPDRIELQTTLYALLPGTELQQIGSILAFTQQNFLAQNFFKSWVVLCGEACHVTSPISSESMNLGILDAKNLAWKLAAVLRGASWELLQQYETERKEAAQQVLLRNNSTGRFFLEKGFVVSSAVLTVCSPFLGVIDSLSSMTLPERIFYISQAYLRNFGIGQAHLKSKCPPGHFMPSAVLAEIDVNAEHAPICRPLDYYFRNCHVLINFISVLPPGTKQRTMWGCERAEEASRWSRVALLNLSTLTRVTYEAFRSITEASKHPQLEVLWVIVGLADNGRLGDSVDMTSPSSSADMSFASPEQGFSSPMSDLENIIPNELIGCFSRHRLTNRIRIPGDPRLLLDYSKRAGITDRLGLRLRGPYQPKPDGSSGAFVLVRPDGIVAFEGLASDRAAMSAAEDYAMSFFGR